MARRFAALCFSVLLIWPLGARAQGAYGDHIRDREVDDRPSAPEPPPPPPEPVAAPFGSRGQWVVTGASGIGVGSTTWSGSKASSLWVTFAPGLDLFVVKNLSIGVSLNLAYSDHKGYAVDGTLVETKQTTYSGGARLGVNLPIARRLSLYPRLTAGYQTVHTTEQDVGAGSTFGASSFDAAHDGPWGSIDVPLVFVPKPQFFVAVVPSVTVDAAGGGQGGPGQGGAHTTGGAGFLVGGWFGGPPAEAPAEPVEAEPAPRLPRFGDAGVVVLSSELEAYGHQTAWSGPDSLAYTEYGFEAGVDYFVADHVSVGAALWWMQSSAQGVDLRTAAAYTNHESRAGGVVRGGVEWPLGPHLSLYPRLTLGLAGEDYDIESAGKANKGHDDDIYASAYVPLLVHVARHVFVGFGPSGLADLSRTFTPSNTSNKATSVGAGLTVGGWL
jgi:hypothetical protein